MKPDAFDVLAQGLRDAQAKGLRVVTGSFHERGPRGDVVACCALGSLTLDGSWCAGRFADEVVGLAAERLEATEHEVWALAEGFDGVDPDALNGEGEPIRRYDDARQRAYEVGQRLRREFVEPRVSPFASTLPPPPNAEGGAACPS